MWCIKIGEEATSFWFKVERLYNINQIIKAQYNYFVLFQFLLLLYNIADLNSIAVKDRMWRTKIFDWVHIPNPW